MIEELLRKHNGFYHRDMWPKRNSKYLQPAAYSRRSSTFIDREFQLRFSKYVLIFALTSTFIFVLPLLYFSNQNYSIFFDLADLLNPDLARYIAKERMGFNVAFAVTLIANICFWLVFSKRMTAKIVGPLKIMRNHIRLLSRGDFTLPPVKLRDDDEFKELVSTYNYLYSLLKARNEKELHSLHELKKAITNPIARELIAGMIEERQNRINVSNDEPRAEARDSRHVS